MMRDQKQQFSGNPLLVLSFELSLSLSLGLPACLKEQSYEKLGVAKHKSEVLLSLKQQSKGRRNRVIATDQILEKYDDKTRGAPKYQTFHDGGRSMSYTLH
jgi:hypothetical protein